MRAGGKLFPEGKVLNISFLSCLAVLIICGVNASLGKPETVEVIFYPVCAVVIVGAFLIGRGHVRCIPCSLVCAAVIIHVLTPLQILCGRPDYLAAGAFLTGCIVVILLHIPSRSLLMVGTGIVEISAVGLVLDGSITRTVYLALLALLSSSILYAVRHLFVAAIEEYSLDNEYLNMNNEELINTNTRDKLTGLFNRAYYDSEIRKAVQSGAKGAKTSLLMLDIDHFKHVNDTFGHDVGDIALKALAGIIRENIRDNDIACRYGGEEFVIIMYCELEVAARRAEQIRKAVEAAYIETVGSITVSIGVAAYKEGMDAEAFFKAADDMVYAAKEGGRNQVRVLRVRTYGHLSVVE